MKKTALLRLLSLAFALSLSLTACGPAKTDSKPTGGKKENTQVDTSEIEMPTADLSNNSKVLKVFGWSTMSENETDGEAAEYFKEEFGVTLDETVSTHETYWSDLAKMVAAGNAPDVVDLSYDKYFPTPMAGGLLEPWDGLIDFSSDLWASTKDLVEANKWKDKIYCPVISEFVSSWCYYNKNMFKNYGLEEQNPRALWEKGEWTLDKMISLSDEFLEKNNRNEVTQYGMTVQNIELLSTTGIQLFDIKNGTEIVNNLNNPKIAKVFNDTYKVSEAGSGSFAMSADACPLFE